MPKLPLMMHKALAGLDTDTLEKYAPEALQTQLVTAVLLALGSNYHAEKYLAMVRERLSALGEIQLSTAFQNPDFTATPELPKPDYTNQCVYLSLKSPMTLQQLQQTFKQFECECHRQRLAEPSMSIKQVTMDIDVLLVNLYTKENSLSKNCTFKWIIMNDRYPFKAHEKAGVQELILTKL
ncbi:2-amino-4-hydroxy-6-hydroxymethyldihydropteridine diphosphokinase [Psychrobacter vallis]|uniref:2-amino-4-hydroxy-6- hydroxymethyldihydropteridine diphosphokinase n=1 Tax=Psychrobacter vallis TaxID=248451 RepID=UPI001D10EDD4|nr:2-amino-4-hydroxy-6-hydroxymethyldihydropteridine diphosphokinase [Psychrobacter vallis]